MKKKQRSGRPAESMREFTAWFATASTAAVALTLTSCTCLSVLAVTGVDVNIAAAAIGVVLLAVSKVCNSLGRR